MPPGFADDLPDISAATKTAVSHIVDQLAVRYQDIDDRRAWVVAFSGGKDSTLLLHLVLEAVKKVRPSRRTRPVHVLSSDTQVETPVIARFVRDQLVRVQHGADQLSLPVTTHLVTPELHETFWVRLIGYGYAAPTRNFRWCTDRLKIKPSNVLVATLVAEHRSVLVLTGSRYAESAHRAASLRKHTATGVINRHSTVRGAWMWAPIRNLNTDQVWEYLALTPAPWGSHHRELLNLYKDSSAGECHLALDETTQPCGNSRWGCWTCTVVQRDRSIEGFIGSGYDTYAGLAEFRNWLVDLRDDPHKVYREPVRRNGRPGNGPLRLGVREQVLTRLLALQQEVGFTLISRDEIALIKQVWISDSLIDSEPHDSTVVDLPMPTVRAAAQSQSETG